MLIGTFLLLSGRDPVTSDLTLENAGIICDPRSRKILVDENDATNIDGVYAIGDVALV